MTDDAGGYELLDLRPGEHRIALTHPSYLRRELAVVVAAGRPVEAPPVTLLGGDVDQDGRIGLADANRIALSWYAVPGDAIWSPEMDVTDDARIDLLDAVAVRYNWGRTADGGGQADDAPAASGPTAPEARIRLVAEPAAADGSVVVRVLVDGAADLNAARLVLGYDASRLRLSGLRPGGAWDPAHRLVLVERVDARAGRAELAVAQTRPAPPISGTAELARFQVRPDGGRAVLVRLVEAELRGADPTRAEPLPFRPAPPLRVDPRADPR